mgnify:CR=1 FL=1
MNKYVERLYNGVIKENPTFVLMLGMCPTLAVTSSAINGLGMGLSARPRIIQLTTISGIYTPSALERLDRYACIRNCTTVTSDATITM